MPINANQWTDYLGKGRGGTWVFNLYCCAVLNFSKTKTKLFEEPFHDKTSPPWLTVLLRLHEWFTVSRRAANMTSLLFIQTYHVKKFLCYDIPRVWHPTWRDDSCRVISLFYKFLQVKPRDVPDQNVWITYTVGLILYVENISSQGYLPPPTEQE